MATEEGVMTLSDTRKTVNAEMFGLMSMLLTVAFQNQLMRQCDKAP